MYKVLFNTKLVGQCWRLLDALDFVPSLMLVPGYNTLEILDGENRTVYYWYKDKVQISHYHSMKMEV